ncbi:MAG: Uncharacterized conserved protein, DUF1800 family [Chloroflexi bacterium]|nr:MAG: Uncharacterized conserved protein, DUF1800 family [Chloroflexota bacterium]
MTTATGTDTRLSQTAHLLRRAGMGSSRSELEAYAEQPYADVVEQLLHPDQSPEVPDDVLNRYFTALVTAETPFIWDTRWVYRMTTTARPLQEKMALFWHHVFATAWFKGEHGLSIEAHIDMLRREGLSNFRTLLLELSKDPAMIFWLDNCENHGSDPNENYGRELLELFSMGLGSYSEADVKNAAYAFTGWSFRQPIPLYPYGGFESDFLYRPDDHDGRDKQFLGASGPLNGEDIIDEIVGQEATARFIARHLYNFFVADEAQVPAWSVQEPNDPAAIDTLVQAFRDSDGDMRQVMRVLFNADFFKAARFQRVKCPAEFIIGVFKLTEEHHDEPKPELAGIYFQMAAMGQKLMDPPSVEGWHTGKEWIDSGTLMERVNFAVKHVGNAKAPGIIAIAGRLAAQAPLSTDALVDALLDEAGSLEVSDTTRAALREAAGQGDPAQHATADGVAKLLGLVVATPEYQFA